MNNFVETTLWEYKVITATFGASLESDLNDWGSLGWEVVSMAGMNGTMTLTGNKIFVVLKRESAYREQLRSFTRQYIEQLEAHYGADVFSAVVARSGDEAVFRAIAALVATGQPTDAPIAIVEEAAVAIAASENPSRDQFLVMSIIARIQKMA